MHVYFIIPRTARNASATQQRSHTTVHEYWWAAVPSLRQINTIYIYSIIRGRINI
jgi:hypothetical protein